MSTVQTAEVLPRADLDNLDTFISAGVFHLERADLVELVKFHAGFERTDGPQAVWQQMIRKALATVSNEG